MEYIRPETRPITTASRRCIDHFRTKQTNSGRRVRKAVDSLTRSASPKKSPANPTRHAANFSSGCCTKATVATFVPLLFFLFLCERLFFDDALEKRFRILSGTQKKDHKS